MAERPPSSLAAPSAPCWAEEPQQVVRTGLYRYSRNPMYVGVITAIVGQAIVYRSHGIASLRSSLPPSPSTALSSSLRNRTSPALAAPLTMTTAVASPLARLPQTLTVLFSTLIAARRTLLLHHRPCSDTCGARCCSYKRSTIFSSPSRTAAATAPCFCRMQPDMAAHLLGAGLQRVRAVAAALRSWGIGKGDRVAILSENRWEWAIADFACLALGAVDVPIYPNLLADQIIPLLADSGSRVIFVSTRAQYDKIAPHRSATALEHVVVMDDDILPGAETFSSLIADTDNRGSQRDADFDDAALPFSPPISPP